MDSQEKNLVIGTAASPVEEQEVKEVVIQAAEAPEVVTTEAAEPLAQPEEAVPEAEEQPRKVYETKKEILDRIKDIAHGDETPQKDEIDYLKTVFYKIHIAEREAALKAYIDGGGDPEAYQITRDEDEEVFKAEMGIIKEKRAQLFKEQEAEKQVNLEKKLAIIEKIKNIITSPEEANKSYQEFKTLQSEWREIKNVPAEKASELWRNYQLYVEQLQNFVKQQSVWLKRQILLVRSISFKSFMRNIVRSVLLPKNSVKRFGTASSQHLPSSTNVTSSILKVSALKKRRTSHARPSSVRRQRPSLPRRTKAQATGRNTQRRSSISRQNGRPSALPHRR